MNSSLLEYLGGESDVKYREQMRLVLKELSKKNTTPIPIKIFKCENCGSCADDKYTMSIYWHEYKFCSERCQWELSYDIRKTHRPSR